MLFEWLARFNSADDAEFEDQAELRVLWNLEAVLESTLVEPFHADWPALLAAARSRIRDEWLTVDLGRWTWRGAPGEMSRR